MSRDKLIGYLMPLPELTLGFCLPVFQDTKDIYIQFASESRSSPNKDYLDEDTKHKVVLLKESIDVSASTYYFGILGLDKDFAYGNRTQMVNFLKSRVSDFSSHPFIALEVSRFIEDESLALKFLHESNSLLTSLNSNSSKVWFTNELAMRFDEPEKKYEYREQRRKRRREVRKREIVPDPIYNSITVTKFIYVLLQSTRSINESEARALVYASFDFLKKSGYSEPLKAFYGALANIAPKVEVKQRKVGGKTFQVPVEVRVSRRTLLGMKLLIKSDGEEGNPTLSPIPLAQKIIAYFELDKSVSTYFITDTGIKNRRKSSFLNKKY